MFGFSEGVKWRASVTMFTTMRTLSVVFEQPFIQISLQVFQRSIQLFAERNLVEFILNGAMEPLTNAIRLR